MASPLPVNGWWLGLAVPLDYDSIPFSANSALYQSGDIMAQCIGLVALRRDGKNPGKGTKLPFCVSIYSWLFFLWCKCLIWLWGLHFKETPISKQSSTLWLSWTNTLPATQPYAFPQPPRLVLLLFGLLVCFLFPCFKFPLLCFKFTNSEWAGETLDSHSWTQ